MEQRDSPEAGRNVARIMSIVEALAEAADGGLRLSDAMQTTGLNKTTAHRLLASLVAQGLADQDGEGRYFIGIRLLSLATIAKRRFRLPALIEPILANLSRQTQDTISLVARIEDEAVCLECIEGSFPIKVLTLRAGDRRPLGIGAGSLALLAFLPESEVDRILREQARVRTDYPFDELQIRQMIATARRDGYAYNDVHVFRGMEAITHMAGIGVPIRAGSGTPVAALHLTAITQRLAPSRREEVVAALRREAETIEAVYRPVLDTMEPRRRTVGNEHRHSAFEPASAASGEKGKRIK